MKIGKSFAGVNVQSVSESIILNRRVILGSVLLALVLGFGYTFFLQYCTWLVVLVSLLGLFVGGGYTSVLSFKKYRALQASSDSTENQEKMQSLAGFYKWVAYLLWLTLLLLLVAVLCLWSRIKLAVSVMEAAAEFVSQTKTVVLVPALSALIGCGYLAFWLYAFLGYYATGQVTHDPKYPWGKITISDETDMSVKLHIFALFWNMAFLLTCSHFIIATATAIWYFRGAAREEERHPLLKGLWWIFRYHLGTIAFGSLILAIVWLLRVITQYIHEEAKRNKKADKLARCLIACTLCLLKVLEKFVKFFNKHAYIECAVRSTNYCVSARNGMNVVGSNLMRFGVLHGLGEIVMFINVLFMSLSGTFIGYIMLVFYGREDPEMQGTAASLTVASSYSGCLRCILADRLPVRSRLGGELRRHPPLLLHRR